MRKILLLGLLLALMMPLTTMAQLKFGIGAGLNYTSLSDINFDSRQAIYDSRTGYHLGVFVDLSAGPLALRPGLYYMTAGSLFEDGLSDLFSIDDNFDMSFVVVPIDVRFRIPFPFVKPYVHAGPELRFRSGEVTGEIEESLDLRSFNMAGNLGFGVEVDGIGFSVMPEFRYTFDISGLTGDTVTIGESTFTADDDHKSRAFMLRLGVGF